jgi:hypothetical protein
MHSRLKKPVLSAKEMAEWNMRNPKEYRIRNLEFLSKIHSESYVEQVKQEMLIIHSKKKGNKK